MPKSQIKIFSIQFSFLKYSMILLGLILLQNTQSITEINLIIKSNAKDDKWTQIIGEYYFEKPSKIVSNGYEVENNKWINLNNGIFEITVIYNTEIDTCENMFSGVTTVDEIIFKDYKNFKPKTMKNMFGGSTYKKIIFQKFDTSSVTDMSKTFNQLSILEELDISIFNTASVTTMNYMFRECGILK